MILKKPFDFKSLKLLNNSQTVQAINRYITIDYPYIKENEKVKLKPFTDHYTTLNPVILYGLSDTEKDIPGFNHPIINTEHKWIALDLRPYVRLTENKDSIEPKNEAEYTLAIQRFILTAMWATDKQGPVYSLKLGHFAFASWLSENLTRKFGLDLQNQLQLRVLALIYYAHLFTDDFGQDDFDKLLIRSKEDSLIPRLIEEVREDAGVVENIDDFCRACYDVTKNIRLKGLDFNVLTNVVANNWMGANGKELALLSLEHPPTWLSLVHASLTNRSFKKNFIATVVDKHDKRGKGEEFLSVFSAITRDYKEGDNV